MITGNYNNPGSVNPADQSFGVGIPTQQPAPGGPLPNQGGTSSGVGPPGPTGPTGPASTVPGPTGPASTVPGPSGPTGPTGADSTVPGPTGPTGPASTVPGPSGPTGPTGPASTVPGPSGPTGPTGADSTVPGPTGPTGPSSLTAFTQDDLGDGETYKQFNPAALAVTGGTATSLNIDGAGVTVIPTVSNSTSGWVAGNIIHFIAPTVAALAKADTSGNCAGPLYVWSGTQAIPIRLWKGALVFDGTPTCPGAAYLSATVAGAATSNMPAVPAIAWPVGYSLVNTSAGAAYAAQGNWQDLSPIIGASLQETLLLQTAAALGGVPSDYTGYFDDFDKLYNNGTYDLPSWSRGGRSGNFYNGHFSQIGNGISGYAEEMYFYAANFGNPASVPMDMAIRVSVTTPAGGSLCCACGMLDALGNAIGVGFIKAGTAYWIGFNGAGNPEGGSGSGGVNLGAISDTNMHTLYMRSFGDGNLTFRLDSGAWSSPVVSSVTAVSQVMPFCGAGTGFSFACDWVYLARKNR